VPGYPSEEDIQRGVFVQGRGRGGLDFVFDGGGKSGNPE